MQRRSLLIASGAPFVRAGRGPGNNQPGAAGNRGGR